MDVPSDIGLLSPLALVELVLALVAENKALRAENALLREENALLRAENAALREELEELRRENASLRGEIEELKRAVGRSASPFSRNRRKSVRKRPGRKAGQGAFSHRQAPGGSGPVEEAPVEATVCPRCGGALEAAGSEFVTTSDLATPAAPKVRRVRVWICRCCACGHTVRGHHPDVAESQQGATAHRLGPLVKAAALALHHDCGIPQRKVPAVIESLTGFRVTQGALTQWCEAAAEGKAGEVAERLTAAVRRAPVVNTDDTGWRVDGKAAWLMTYVTRDSTVFRIRPRHRSDEVLEVIPRDYAGVMATDRGPSYDAHAFDGVRQSKCVAHLFRSLDAAMANQPPAAWPVTAYLRDIFERALALWHASHDGRIGGEAFAAREAELRAELTHALRRRRLKDPDNLRIVGELAWHNKRGSLLRFLDDPAVEPTNNSAERALRPAVIARKVSHCSRNDRGAHAYATLKTIAVTARQRGIEPQQAILATFQGIDPFADSS